jgi:predicted DNA-binding transcriptional regulator AlpA
MQDSIAAAKRARPAALKPVSAPALLNEGQVAELLGVSRRTVHSLRDQDWFPPAIELGPRALRWPRDELLAALAARAPRVTKQEEPKQLAGARTESRVFRVGKYVSEA